MNIENAKHLIAIKKGYPTWNEMEDFIINNNSSVNVAILIRVAMEEVCELMAIKSKAKSMEALLHEELQYFEYWSKNLSGPPHIMDNFKERAEFIKMTLES